MKYSKITIIILAFFMICFFMPNMGFAATRLFYENYDDCTQEYTALSDVIANSGFDHIGRTNGAGSEGDHAIINENYDGGSGYSHRVNHGNGGTGLQDQWEDVGESSTGEHYISYWYRLDSTYGLNSGWSHKNMRFWHADDGNMSDIVMEMHIYGCPFSMDIGPQVDYALTAGSRWGFTNEPDHASEFSSGVFEWHHVEVWIKYDSPAGAGNGEMKVWIDDILQIDKKKAQITKAGYPSYTRFSIPSNMTCTDAPAPNYYYIDEVEIWDGMPDGSVSTDGSVSSVENIFVDDFESGDKSKWDDSHSSLVIDATDQIGGNFSLMRQHATGTTSTGSCDKGFGDNAVPGYTGSGSRINDATFEADVKFSSSDFNIGDSTTKIMILESWPSNAYPSTATKDFQAIVEVDGHAAHEGEFIVTIKREDWDFYTLYQGDTPVTVAPDTTYALKLRVKLDDPYDEENGVVELWINGELKISSYNEDLVLASRGSNIPKGLNTLMLTGYTGGSGSPDNKYQYWDNVELYITTDAGLLAPTGLEVSSP